MIDRLNWMPIFMSIKLHNRTVRNVTVIDIAGRVTLGEGSTMMGKAIRELLSQGNRNIVLNLKDVSYIDSAGLGELISATVTVTNFGGTLKLVSLSKRTEDLISTTKCTGIFDIYTDETVAISGFE